MHPHPTHPLTHPPLTHPSQLPAWSLVLFGCYALTSIGLGLVHFGDAGDAAATLAVDVAEATQRLTRKGYVPPKAR